MTQPFDVSNVLEEEAEEHLVKVLEKRRERAAASDKGWDASVEGERPPLRRVTIEGAAMFSPTGQQNERSGPSAHKGFRKLAKSVFAMKSQGRLNVDQSETLGQVGGQEVEAHDVFLGVGGEKTKLGKSHFSLADTNTDRLFSAAVAVNENFKQEDEVESVATNPDSEHGETMDEERLPLTGIMEPQRCQERAWFSYGLHGFAKDAESRQRTKADRKKRRERKKKCRKMLEKASCCFGRRSWFAEVFHPAILTKVFFDFILRSWFSRIGLPALIMAFILFYHMGNPSLVDFDQATASWWLIFIARQCLMLELAIAIDYVIIDVWALRSRLVVNLFGPWLTLFIIDAKGWPFIAISKWSMCSSYLYWCPMLTIVVSQPGPSVP